jgi:NADH-quinone oxidoreductase subunit J
MTVFLHYVFASMALVSGVMVISAVNPVHSVLFLILVFCNIFVILLMLGAEFLAMLFITVYVGAIAVLFLFVVMMLPTHGQAFGGKSLVTTLPIGLIVGACFAAELFFVLCATSTSRTWGLYYQGSSTGSFMDHASTVVISDLVPDALVMQVEELTSVEVLGRVLFTEYFSSFLLSSLILLVAMVGAIVLTMHRRGEVRRQEVCDQVNRSFDIPSFT